MELLLSDPFVVVLCSVICYPFVVIVWRGVGAVAVAVGEGDVVSAGRAIHHATSSP
jgi:hypothetical protein